MVEVTQEEANNYCLVLTALGMEEEGDPVAAVKRLTKDAERYRWLRSRLPGAAYRVAGVIYSEGGPGVDAGIDAAMASARGVGAA